MKCNNAICCIEAEACYKTDTMIFQLALTNTSCWCMIRLVPANTMETIGQDMIFGRKLAITNQDIIYFLKNFFFYTSQLAVTNIPV